MDKKYKVVYYYCDGGYNGHTTDEYDGQYDPYNWDEANQFADDLFNEKLETDYPNCVTYNEDFRKGVADNDNWFQIKVEQC